MSAYKDSDGFNLEFDSDIADEERRFYMKVYPSVNQVWERKVHCTTCNLHIGTAPIQENLIRMHPVLKVTHCKKCHEFYNSGEFSKGEDGSELYCRWCGQGGEVYCCAKCPYVFCKSCIVNNLSNGCVTDIEENENWNCFVCAPKIMWHLRAQHWALMNSIEKQKQAILSGSHPDDEVKQLMKRDSTTCCKGLKPIKKSENMSDSSSENELVPLKPRKRKLSRGSDSPSEKMQKKTIKTNNSEVVCTPDVLSLLQPINPSPQKPPTENLLTVPTQRPNQLSIQQPTVTVVTQTPTSASLPPLVIRSLNTQVRPTAPPAMLRKSVVGSRPPSATPGQTPVYHTINGFRIDLNTAAQQETYRLPNGKLIQVKKQGTTTRQNVTGPQTNNLLQQNTLPVTIHNQGVRPQLIRQMRPASVINSQASQQQIPHFSIQTPNMATIRYAATNNQQLSGNAALAAAINASQTTSAMIGQLVNGNVNATTMQQQLTSRPTPIPTLVRQFFASTPLGKARTQLQNEIFSGMDICQHLTGKIHTLTNSNAYKSVRNFTDVKELYIHLSYLFTYAIGRFKTLQDKCMEDMRRLGFAGDAASLESGNIGGDKQANEPDDDDIEIVEPKTTCIDLDSDNEDNTAPPSKEPLEFVEPQLLQMPEEEQHMECDVNEIAANLLAGMLEVELTEGSSLLVPSHSVPGPQPKKPRKKTTNKPNPHLVKQRQLQMLEKERQERQKLMKCPKLTMSCQVNLERVDETDEKVKKLLERWVQEQISGSIEDGTSEHDKILDDDGLARVTVEMKVDGDEKKDETISSETSELEGDKENTGVKTNVKDSVEKQESKSVDSQQVDGEVTGDSKIDSNEESVTDVPANDDVKDGESAQKDSEEKNCTTQNAKNSDECDQGDGKVSNDIAVEAFDRSGENETFDAGNTDEELTVPAAFLEPTISLEPSEEIEKSEETDLESSKKLQEAIEDPETIDEKETIEDPETIDEKETIEEPEAMEESGVMDKSEAMEESGTMDESEPMEESGAMDESEAMEKSEVMDESGPTKENILEPKCSIDEPKEQLEESNGFAENKSNNPAENNLNDNNLLEDVSDDELEDVSDDALEDASDEKENGFSSVENDDEDINSVDKTND